MAKPRQIQIRRGTATEHANFIGANGEITMDTTNKTIRVHDGQTRGGTILAKQSDIPEIANADYVVESQLPTAENNYTWYRKYKSGWVEQGGTFGPMFIQYSEIKIILPVPMADANYCGFVTTLGNAKNYTPQLAEKTTTYVKFGFVINLADFGATWLVQGMSAPSE